MHAPLLSVLGQASTVLSQGKGSRSVGQPKRCAKAWLEEVSGPCHTDREAGSKGRNAGPAALTLSLDPDQPPSVLAQAAVSVSGVPVGPIDYSN